jgi:hypothetical protein
MIIQRTDPRFWDVRVVERRIRRGELTRADLEAHLDGLPDVSDHSTPSVPVEEPDLRARERRPMVKVLPPTTIGRVGSLDRSRLDDDDLDDDDDDLDDDDDDDDDEDDDDDDE